MDKRIDELGERVKDARGWPLDSDRALVKDLWAMVRELQEALQGPLPSPIDWRHVRGHSGKGKV